MKKFKKFVLYSLFNNFNQDLFLFQSIPVVYALLNRKTESAYIRLWQFVRHELNLSLDWDNLCIITDFETALRNGIGRVSPECRQLGCHFHYTQVKICNHCYYSSLHACTVLFFLEYCTIFTKPSIEEHITECKCSTCSKNGTLIDPNIYIF